MKLKIVVVVACDDVDDHIDGEGHQPLESRRIVARNHSDAQGHPTHKARYVAEVQYDPIAKLVARFGAATLVRA